MLKVHPALLAFALWMVLLAPVAARATMTHQSTAPQDQEQAVPAQSEDNSPPPAEGSLAAPNNRESSSKSDGETTPPEPLPLTPAQRLQGEIFVLRDQAEGFIQQAESIQEPPEEIQRLLRETKAAIAATAGVNRLFEVDRLTQLRDQLLDVPLRLYEAIAAASTPVPAPQATKTQKPRQPRTTRPRTTRPGTTQPGTTQPGATQPGATQPKLVPETERTASTVPVDPGPAGHEVAPALRRGALAYFSGDYQRAVETLEPVALPTPRSQALALLLRAAARHALFLNADQPNEGQLAMVQAEIQECLRLAPRLRPDPELFSPRFVRLFASSPGS